MQMSFPGSGAVIPHSSQTSLRAVTFMSSLGSCFPLGRSQRPLRLIIRYSFCPLWINPPAALISVRKGRLHIVLNFSSGFSSIIVSHFKSWFLSISSIRHSNSSSGSFMQRISSGLSGLSSFLPQMAKVLSSKFIVIMVLILTMWQI